MLELRMPPPLARAIGPTLASVVYGVVGVIVGLALWAFALMTIDTPPDVAELTTRSGTLDGIGIERGRRSKRAAYVLQIKDRGVITEFRVADWNAENVDQLALDRIGRGAPAVLTVHEHGRLGTLRDIYELDLAGRRLLTLARSLAAKQTDVDDRRTTTGPLGVVGFAALLAAMIWSLVAYELPAIRQLRDEARGQARRQPPEPKPLARRVRDGLHWLVLALIEGLREWVSTLAQHLASVFRFLGLIGMGALIMALATAWAAARWNDDLPSRGSVERVTGSIGYVRRHLSGRETLLDVVVVTPASGPVVIPMRPSTLQAAGVDERRLADAVGASIDLEVERSNLGAALQIYSLAVGGQPYLTWERSRQRLLETNSAERMIACGLGALGGVVGAAGIVRRLLRRGATRN